MRTALDRWGNSLGVRLPKAIVEEAGLREGDRVEIQVENGAVTIRPARPRFTLEELLVGMSAQTVHPEVDAGAAVGAERFWEEQ